MNKGTTTTKGYYSILQYVPNPERAEGVNIGLMLFCPEKNFLKIHTAERNDRARRLLGKRRDSSANLSRLDAFKTAFEERVELEADRIETLEDFRAFVNTRANQLRLTDPRPVKVADPEAELSNLFALLVEEDDPTHEPTQRAKTAIKRQFNQLLIAHKLDDVVERGFPVELPSLGRQHYPFAFSNGQPNVIEPETFELSRQREITERACRLVIEGQDLSKQKKPIKLNVIGSFKAGQDEQIKQVRRLLKSNQVSLYTVDEMEKLIKVIAKTAHV
jgi:Protein of unknown function (DUF3037)